MNPGNLYLGPSAKIRYNQSEDVVISNQNDWKTEFINNSRDLWGVSLRLELSMQDQKNNRKRTSSELINVKKDIEDPARDIFRKTLRLP